MIFSAAILTWGFVRAICTAWKFRFGFSAECRTVEAMLHQFDELRKDENSARALLMQLRVYQMQNEEGRSGFAVTAFSSSQRTLSERATTTPEPDFLRLTWGKLSLPPRIKSRR
jgi:hypothetical protein